MSTESDEEPLSVSAAAGASGVAETAVKRKATDTPSSSVVQRSKRPRSQGTWEAAFQKAENDNLLGIVIIQRDCYTQLNQLQVEEIRQKLMSKLHSAFNSGLTPRFENSGRRNGRFCLSCANQVSFDLLQTTVDGLIVTARGNDGTSSQHQLSLVTPSEIPKLIQAIFLYFWNSA